MKTNFEIMLSVPVLQWAEMNNVMFKTLMSEFGYEAKYTFFGDLAIAEAFGAEAIKETYDRVLAEWLADIEAATEFVMALNHRCWFWYSEIEKNKTNEDYAAICEALSKLYSTLYCAADEKVLDRYEGNDKAIEYYYRITD